MGSPGKEQVWGENAVLDFSDVGLVEGLKVHPRTESLAPTEVCFSREAWRLQPLGKCDTCLEAPLSWVRTTDSPPQHKHGFIWKGAFA